MYYPTAVTARASDSGLQIVGSLAVLLIILIAWALGLGKHDPNKWYGKMTCSRCGYFWESRRSTPPGRCPRCSSNRVNQQLG